MRKDIKMKRIYQKRMIRNITMAKCISNGYLNTK